MGDDSGQAVLGQLTELSKVDGVIATLSAEKKKIEGNFKTRLDNFRSIEQKRSLRAQVLADKKGKYDKETKALGFERDKLVDRRKALQTLNNYKLQQAAGKEIEYAGKQLTQREELLLSTLSEVEALEKEIAEFDTVLSGLKGELELLELESTEAIENLVTRLTEQNEIRGTILAGISDKAALSQYSRIRERYPANPLAPLKNRESCSGCFMKVGPQVFVQISKGLIVKCPGCGRIVIASE